MHFHKPTSNFPYVLIDCRAGFSKMAPLGYSTSPPLPHDSIKTLKSTEIDNKPYFVEAKAGFPLIHIALI